MKILQVVSYFYPAMTYGGPAKVAYDLSKELSNKHKVVVYTTDVWDEKRRIRKSEKLKSTKSFQVKYFPNLVNNIAFKQRMFTGFGMTRSYFIDKNNYDIVHIHDVFIVPQLMIGLLAYLSRKPYVVSPHGVLDAIRMKDKSLAKFIVYNLFAKPVLKGAKSLIATSEKERKDLIKLGFNDVVTVYNGIGKIKTKPSGRFESYRDKRMFTMLYIGKIHHLKGLRETLLALGNVKFNYQVLIAGPDDGGKEELVRIIDKNKLKHVHFLGFVNESEKVSLFNLADIFVHPSLSEGFSIVILEALYAKLPVLITEACNFDDVKNYKAGAVLKGEDLEKEIGRALIRLHKEPGLLKEMGKNGRILLDNRYSISAMAEKLKKIYEVFN